MNKIAIAIHGGASEETSLLRENRSAYENSLKEITEVGYAILASGGSALDAVEETVSLLEDDPLFNAGRGSVLNSDGEVEMDASMMCGKLLDAGAVSMVQEVKNPIRLARLIMEKTHHVFMSGYGAKKLAELHQLEFKPKEYFITDYQYQEFLRESNNKTVQQMFDEPSRGTVGAVALDSFGNIAAATSTGGTGHCLPGRVGDSCIIGAGCYANNDSCAVSGTGEGEALIANVVAHSIAMLVQLKQWPLQKACDYVIHECNIQRREMGVIALNRNGEISAAFNTEVMKRAWKASEQDLQVHLY